jgi:hypothetical protein
MLLYGWLRWCRNYISGFSRILPTDTPQTMCAALWCCPPLLLQAKMEQERLAAAAAREAAKAAARAGAQQREAARQQQAAYHSSRISARLKEAAQRRCVYLYVEACTATFFSSSHVHALQGTATMAMSVSAQWLIKCVVWQRDCHSLQSCRLQGCEFNLTLTFYCCPATCITVLLHQGAALGADS